MKLNYLFFVLLIFYGHNPSLRAQDYRTFRSADVHYFREHIEGNILASQIDSARYIDGNLILYPFKTYRVDSPYYAGWLTHGWMGKKIVVQPDGVNLFFNKDADSIFIHTEAEIGESFTMYTYESGTTIQATVVSIEEELVFDVIDTVKTFVLSSEEPSFDFEMLSFRIGKNSGMLDVYPFYSFPEKYLPIYGSASEAESYHLVGQLYPRKGITKPTEFEVRNIDVGDVIGYNSYNNGELWRKRLTILDKIMIDFDRVEYTIEKEEHYHRDGYSEAFPDFDSIYTDIIYVEANISNDFISEELIPEKDYRRFLNGGSYGLTDYTLKLTYNEPCGFIEKFYSEGEFLMDESDTLGSIGEPIVRTKIFYTNGLYTYNTFDHVGAEDNEHSGATFSSSLIDGVICGSGNFLSTDDFKNESEFVLYPNPSNGNFTVGIEGEFAIEMYALDGKLVYANSQQITPQISLSGTIPTGTYFIVITQQNKVYNHKLVVR